MIKIRVYIINILPFITYLLYPNFLQVNINFRKGKAKEECLLISYLSHKYTSLPLDRFLFNLAGGRIYTSNASKLYIEGVCLHRLITELSLH